MTALSQGVIVLPVLFCLPNTNRRIVWIEPVLVEAYEIRSLMKQVVESVSGELGPAMESVLGRIQDLSPRNRPMLIGMLTGKACTLFRDVGLEHLQKFEAGITTTGGDNPVPLTLERPHQLLPRDLEPQEEMDIRLSGNYARTKL